MLIGYKRGQGSIVLRVKILNSSVATGAGLTGLTSASSGLIISTIADNEATATAYTVAASNVETITTLGTYAAPTAGKCRFKEVDATNHKGVYEIQIADARFAVSSAKSLLVSVSGATNAAETDVVIPLRDLDPFDAVRAGLTALPNVASGSAGAIITSGTGTAQLSVSSGAVTVGTNNDKTGYSLTQAFPANFNSLAITAGGSVTAGTVSDKTGYSLSGSQTFSTSGSVGSVTGAVGSVTGSVGSVTGNVGGNVVGSVGSVVGTVTANTTQLAGQTVTAAAGVTFPASVSSLTAAGVRTELATELGRIDVATSTRLATSGYTAPMDAAGTRSAIGLATANLDTQLGDLPTATENAAAVWNALIASYTVTGSFGQRVLRSSNTQSEVAVTGSNHVAADIHETQPGSIHATTFDAGAIDSNALAASAATEIATATLGATVEGSETLTQSVRLMRAALVGKLSGAATTTVTIRDAADSKARITATVDADGNRSAITTDAT